MCKVIHKVHRFRILFEQTTNVFRLSSHLVPKHGARVRFTLGANVSTYFSQALTREFGRYARASVIGHQMVPVSLGYPESEHNTVLCRRPGSSARAPSVITALLRLASKRANLPHYLVLAVQPPMICRQERILKKPGGRLKLCNTVTQVRINKQVLFESQAKVTRVKEMSLSRQTQCEHTCRYDK